jgi:type II secretory pathway pseudopilin PulG
MPGRTCRTEGGYALIEVLISAMLLLTVAAGVFTALDSGTRASAQERHRAQAHSLAEDDQARIRSRPAQCPGSDLNCTTAVESLLTPQSRIVTQGGTPYTIVSRAQFGNETASTNPCSIGSGSRDYLKISSTVTWPTLGSRPAVVASSLMPVPRRAGLQVNIVDRNNNGVPGIGVSGTGPAGFSGTTGPTGCVRWSNLPASATYLLSVSAGGRVDDNGNPAPGNAPTPALTTSVRADSVNSVTLMLDFPGRISNIGFRTRNYSNGLATSSADSVVVGFTGKPAKVFNSAGHLITAPPTTGRASQITTDPILFPFTSPYFVYAGSCVSNQPPAGQPLGSVIVPPGASGTLASPGFIQLPSLQVTVLNGTSPLANARVTARDASCNVTRTLTTATDANGRVQPVGNIGLPFGTYTVCAQNSAGTDRRTTTVALTSAGSTGTPVSIDLQSQPSGTCP